MYSMCLDCRWLFPNSMKCAAYLDGIPKEILEGDIIHDTPINGDHGFIFTPVNGEVLEKEKELPKQNMTLDGFSTTKDLDRQLETILKSIEPEVMKTLKKTKYFDKKE